MSRLPTLPLKRPHAGSQPQQLQLPEPEQKLYDLIRSKEDMGMWTADMRAMFGNNTVLNKTLKSLQAKNLIKEVINVQNKARKYYMGVEFEPSKQLTGGSWYSEGNLDQEFIDVLSRLCLKRMEDDHQVVELEDLCKFINARPVLKEECSLQQVEEIVRTLILDKKVEEMRSTGTGIFAKVKQGKTCYRRLKGQVSSSAKGRAGYLSAIPCGVCPRIRECTPDGVISPKTCVYYNKWLQLEF